MDKISRLNIFQHESRNITIFYLMTIAMNGWFIASNWVYFWTKYMTFGQLGWIDGVGFGLALLLEIPSGAIADMIGKKRTIQIAFLTGAIGILIISLATSLNHIFVGWMISQVCFALYSGASEALAYDTLVDLKKEAEYDHVISKAESLSMYSGALATFIGGLVFSVAFRLPHLLWSASLFVGFFLSLQLIEPHTDTSHFSFKTYFWQLHEGVAELFKPGVRKFAIFFFILSGVYYMYSWGFIRPAIATSFGFYAKEQGFILPILTIAGALVVRLLPKIRKQVSDYKGLIILSVILAISFFFSTFNLGYFGFLLMVVIALTGNLAGPWLSATINARIASKYRATTLSTAALLTRLPYVLLAITAGTMIEEGKLSQFSIGVGAVILVGICISLFFALVGRHRAAMFQKQK